MLKTFWGWRDQQLPDGTVIWTLPGGDTYVTTPGSACLFPNLCAPTAKLPAVAARPDCAGRTAMMPTRTHTRAQNRARHVATERRHNREARQAGSQANPGPAPPDDADEPPPF